MEESSILRVLRRKKRDRQAQTDIQTDGQTSWHGIMFDNVDYWKLFNKLFDDHTYCNIVRILAYWYNSHQERCVRWHNTLSRCSTMGNGTRQGGVLSPVLS